jgi:transposase-like protein
VPWQRDANRIRIYEKPELFKGRHFNHLMIIQAVRWYVTYKKITLDGSRASHQAVAELKAEGNLPAQTLIRTNRYLNNMIEQDHLKAPQRCYPMLGFKIFGNAEVALSGIELANKIKKAQFDTSEITGPGSMIMQVWEAVIAA